MSAPELTEWQKMAADGPPGSTDDLKAEVMSANVNDCIPCRDRVALDDDVWRKVILRLQRVDEERIWVLLDEHGDLLDEPRLGLPD